MSIIEVLQLVLAFGAFTAILVALFKYFQSKESCGLINQNIDIKLSNIETTVKEGRAETKENILGIHSRLDKLKLT